jgi:hypothetical protein
MFQKWDLSKSNHRGAWPLKWGLYAECWMRLPLAVPLPWAFLKELVDGWPYVVFGVKPW